MPEEHLARAMAAVTPRGRALWARRGLASRAALDRTTQAMLLRQLYLAHYEQRRFDAAREVSQQSLELGVLRDVVHQDAARACAALGDVDGAAGHLRLAARHGPASRRAFHYWTLGSLFFNASRHQEAIGALSRAARWGTRDKPLYQAHLAVVRCAAGGRVAGLSELQERLEGAPAGQGYGRFVLGQLAYFRGSLEEARRHLRAFVDRTTGGRATTAIALDAEVEMAKRTLATIEEPRR